MVRELLRHSPFAAHAAARVIRRGRSLFFCEVDVSAPEAGTVARGLVTYKLG